jgi:hypothetical protein
MACVSYIIVNILHKGDNKDDNDDDDYDNTGKPLYLWIQYPRFQLSLVYLGPKKKNWKIE